MATGSLGVPPLDAALGPVPEHATMLLRHEPTVDGLPFLIQAAGTHLRAGHPVTFLCANRGPGRLRWLMQEQGEPHEGITFVDAYSALMGSSEPDCVDVRDPQDLEAVARTLDGLAHGQQGGVLLVDSLSGLLDHSSADRFARAFPALLESFRRFRLAVALHTEWPYGPEIGRLLAGFDAEVRLRGVEDRVVLNSVFQVERSRWSPVRPSPTLYKVVKPGGVVVHVPKILVVGPHHAGKTTLVHTLAQGAVSVDRAGTTVALDRGTSTVGATRVELWGTPGQDRFDPMLPNLAGQASGAILVLDATRPEGFVRGQEMLQKVWRRGLRVVVALNKQDLPGAVQPEAARPLLQAPGDVDILPCTASDRQQAMAVLQRLVDRLLQGA